MDSFAALADPTRRHIVEALAGGEQSFGEIAAKFEMSRPAVSQHLKTLREAGIAIPLPQRDLRVKNFDELADAIKERHTRPSATPRSSGPPQLREVEGGGGEGRGDA